MNEVLDVDAAMDLGDEAMGLQAADIAPDGLFRDVQPLGEELDAASPAGEPELLQDLAFPMVRMKRRRRDARHGFDPIWGMIRKR